MPTKYRQRKLKRIFHTDKESLLDRHRPLTAAEVAKLRSWANRSSVVNERSCVRQSAPSER